MEKKRKELSGQESARQELLKKALSHVLPPEKAERACAALLNAFGSFDGIFSAPEEVLRDTPDVGPETAAFLKLIIDMARVYLEDRPWNLQRVYDTDSAVELFRPKFMGRNTEAVCLMLLDGRGRVLYNDLICEGAVSQVPLYLRKVFRLCLEYSAEDVFLAHNHPSGLAVPSHGDLVATEQLMSSLGSIEARLNDHIIFAGESFYSFKRGGALESLEKAILETHVREIEEVRRLENRIRGKQGSVPGKDRGR